MPVLNLQWTVFGRPVKPVALVLLGTMLLLGITAITDIGVLGNTEWGDVLGGFAFSSAILFIIAWIKGSQTIAEWALLGAFFVWGLRFWAIVFTLGAHALSSEGLYLSFLWMILAGGSWFLERQDPNATVGIRGEKWTPR